MNTIHSRLAYFLFCAAFAITTSLSTAEKADAQSFDPAIFKKFMSTQVEGLKLLEEKKYKEAELKINELNSMARAHPGPENEYLTAALQCLVLLHKAQGHKEEERKAENERTAIITERLRRTGRGADAAFIEKAQAISRKHEKELEIKQKEFDRLKEAQEGVRSMNDARFAADNYALIHNRFPKKVDEEFKKQFTLGLPINEYTKKVEWPIIVEPGANINSSPGRVVMVVSKDAKSYSIYFFDKSGKYKINPKTGKTFVHTRKL